MVVGVSPKLLGTILYYVILAATIEFYDVLFDVRTLSLRFRLLVRQH